MRELKELGYSLEDANAQAKVMVGPEPVWTGVGTVAAAKRVRTLPRRHFCPHITNYNATGDAPRSFHLQINLPPLQGAAFGLSQISQSHVIVRQCANLLGTCDRQVALQ